MIGLSRSGNHAILEWLRAQARGRICLLNATQANWNPFLTARPVGPDDNGAITNYEPFDLQAEQAGRLSRKDLLIITHEDEFLGRVASDNFERYHDGFVGASRARLDVLILRDPFNLMASRMRAGFCGSPRVTMRMWKQHAREFLRDTRYLKHGPVLISYNDWSRDEGYRRGIAHALGLRFTDATINEVARCAGGSSFDGLRYDGNASRMPVLSRWHAYKDDPAFLALFDAEAIRLSERVFGPITGTELLSQPAQLTQVG